MKKDEVIDENGIVIDYTPTAEMMAGLSESLGMAAIPWHYELDDDGYPTEGSLLLIKWWQWWGGYEELMGNVTALIHCGTFEVIPVFKEGSDTELDGLKYTITTGGWSGVEALIGALQCNTMFWANCWQMSKRGGYHEFYIPKALLACNEERFNEVKDKQKGEDFSDLSIRL